MTDQHFNFRDNNGNIAGGDIYINSKPSSWIETKNSLDSIKHHFSIFFSLVIDINKPDSRVINTIQQAQQRMKREFVITSDLKHLNPQHQLEVYDMHKALMNMKHASECTGELITEFTQNLNKISECVDYHPR